MSVLEAPQTWIAAAAVLVVVAVVLIALAPRRRGRAAGDGASSAATSGALGGTTDVPGADARGTDELDVDEAVTGPVTPARGATAHPTDDAVTVETAPWTGDGAATPAPAGTDAADPEAVAPVGPDPAATPSGGVALTRRAGRYVPVTDPARAGERAKDRLLAALLADPTAAVDVVAAMPEAGGASGASASALLRAGLSPAQVAGLCGVEERDLADLVARDLGLLEVATGHRDPAQQGRSLTDDPGRAWASAGSPSPSTTPTTG